MPAVVQPVNVYEVVANYTGPDSAIAANVFHVSGTFTTTPTPTQAGQVAQAVFAGLTTGTHNLVQQMAGSWSLQDCVAYYLTTPYVNGSSTGSAVSGSGGTPALPPSVAIVGSWGAATRYRGGHPRTYMPGIPSSYVDTAGGRMIAGSQLPYLTAAFQNLITAVSGFTISGITSPQLGYIQRRLHGEALDPPVFEPFTGVTVHPRLDSQRRRLGKE